MEWAVNLIIYYLIAIHLWPERRWRPVHILWAVPAFHLSLVASAFLITPILAP